MIRSSSDMVVAPVAPIALRSSVATGEMSTATEKRWPVTTIA